MPSVPKLLSVPLLLLSAALALLFAARPAAAAPLDAPWSGSGTGTTKVVSDGATADPQFTYDSVGSFSGAWTYSTVAGSTRAVPVRWDYSGLHAWFAVTVSLERYIERNGSLISTEPLLKAGPANCCTTPSDGFAYTGTSTFDVKKGDVYGFRMAGSNSDRNRILRGSLTLSEVDGTPPAITPVVTGKRGANGYYAGNARVKWTVADADSRILSKAGCDDATVSQDTQGKTFTCTATSRGGTAKRSVTVKRDATAPQLTVPPLVVKQADGAGAAVVGYAASAKDLLDARPKVACTPPSGSRLAVGTTTVTCTATDAAGNAVRKAFDAVVYPLAAKPQAAPAFAPAPVSGSSKPRRINAVLAFRFVIGKARTKLVQLKVKHVPRGATVKVTCKGNSCPKKLKGKGATRFAKKSSVSLATLFKGGLRNGTRITVKIDKPGALTTVKTLMVRKGKAPVVR